MLALPWLEALATGERARTPRFVFCTGGFSLGSEFGGHPPMFQPEGGPDLVLTPELSPLSGLESSLTLVTGLSIPTSSADGIVPLGGRHGEDDGFHFHFNPLLAGLRQVGDARGATVYGRTPDEVFADARGGQTLLRSLNVSIQPQPYRIDAKPERAILSYRQIGDRIVPVIPDTSPMQVWLKLTSGVIPGDPTLATAREASLLQRRSILDLVERRSDGLRWKLSQEDRYRLDAHFQSVRELEQRLARPVTGVEEDAPNPGEDPEVTAGGWSGEHERALRFNDLVAYALRTDLTRSAAVMYSHWSSYISTRYITSYDWTMHDVLHHGTREQLEEIVLWHMDVWADLLWKLEDPDFGQGSLLDDTTVVYQPEGGFGMMPGTIGGLFTSHSTERMATVIAGRGGGLRPGRHVQAQPGRTHPGNVYLSGLAAAGLPLDRFGEIDGEVTSARPDAG